jgi:hypothetical protein
MNGNDKIKTSNLNHTGIFFEFACFDFIKKFEPFIEETQVPFTLTYGDFQPINGVIDFLCLYHKQNYPLVYFVIECKKSDPAQKNWIFFKRYEQESQSCIFYRSATKPTVDLHIVQPLFSDVCDRGYQVVDSRPTSAYREQTKDQIYNAAIQSSAGLKSIVQDNDNGRFKEAFKMKREDGALVFYVPIVITTAPLFVCDVGENKIDIRTGEAGDEDAQYREKKWIEYSVPIPENLRVGKVDRNNVFIVNSQNMEEFFNTLVSKLHLFEIILKKDFMKNF